MFQLPPDFVSGALEKSAELFEDLKPLIMLLVGIGIAIIILDVIFWILDERAEREATRRRKERLEKLHWPD